jgi:hypothetical protein
VAFTLAARDRRERFPRLERPADLPSAAEVLELKRSFSDWTHIADLGALAVRATLEMPALKLRGDLLIQADGLHRRRTESDFGSYREIALVADGRAWSWTSRGTLEELDGAARAQAELDHPLLPVADWRELYQGLEVLARVQHEDTPAFLVRATPRAGNAHTWVVAEEGGRPLALLAVDEIPGMGLVGSATRYGDWREVGDLVLPFQATVRFASSYLGTAEVRCQGVEHGLALPASAFDPAAIGAGGH